MILARRWPPAACRLHQVGRLKGLRGAPSAPTTEPQGAKTQTEDQRYGGGSETSSGRGKTSDVAQPEAQEKEAQARERKEKEAQARERKVRENVENKISELKKKSMKAIVAKDEPDKFHEDWRDHQGHQVPYRFRIQDRPPRKADDDNDPAARKPNFASHEKLPYSEFVGLRFPTLETAENYDYHKYRGLDRVVEHSFPIRVPGYRRLDPYLREYIYFLHDLDPARFTVARIAERYRLRESTVAKVVQEWGANRYITRSGLSPLREKQRTREAVILDAKEQQYAKWVGYDQLGDEDDKESDDEALGEYKGWRSTNDWVRKQNVEVEMMSAFPMMAKRDPMPKRVDVDLVVDTREKMKVINWIDPTDKVVF